MKHKCDDCKYSGKHQEIGVCYKEHSLIESAKAYKADKCPFAKPVTNFEYIKAMSVEEMAEFISHLTDGYHTPNQNKKRRKEMKKWLKSEVQGE